MIGWLATIEDVVSGRPLSDSDYDNSTVQLARRLAIITFVATAFLGAVIGAYSIVTTRAQSGELSPQPLYNALKLPFVVLITGALSGPMVMGMRYAFAESPDLRADAISILRSLCAGVLGALVWAPLFLCAVVWHVPHGWVTTAMLVMCSLGGIASFRAFRPNLEWTEEIGGGTVLRLLIVVVAFAVSLELCWRLGPFLAVDAPRLIGDGTGNLWARIAELIGWGVR